MKNIITIGGGLAGIEASSALADLGYKVTIIEKEKQLGGKIKNWYHLFPDFTPADNVNQYLENKIKNENISIKTDSDIYKIEKNNEKWFVFTDNIRYFADAILFATGFDLFDASRKEEYGYNIYKNIVTSADLEEKFKNQITLKTSEGKTPEKIAIIHCVGSRDEKSNNHYCSKVCCVTGVKQAIELNKILPETQIYCFYMDLRMFDKHFEELYRSAQEKHNIQFVRGRVSEVAEGIDKNLILKSEDTLSGRPLKIQVDMIVLLAGMEVSQGTMKTGKLCNLEFEASGFLKTENEHNKTNFTSQKGIFATGTCTAPMSVKDTIANARSAAFEIHKFLSHNSF